MKKTVVWIIVAALLIIVGGVIAVGCTFNMIDDPDASVYLESKEYAITGEFEDIVANLVTEDFTLEESKDGVAKVVCLEEESVSHTVEVIDGVLKIKAVDDRAWYERIGIFLKSPSVTVYLPNTALKTLDIEVETGAVDLTEEFSFESVKIESATSAIVCNAKVEKSVNIKTATGAIKLGSFDVESVSLSANTGAIDMERVNCDSLNIENDTGAIRLVDVISSGQFYVKNDTGAIKLERCDGGDMTLKTSTGSIKASLLSDKSFDVDVDVGSANYPKNTTGARCEVRTNTGSVDIEIVK